MIPIWRKVGEGKRRDRGAVIELKNDQPDIARQGRKTFLVHEEFEGGKGDRFGSMDDGNAGGRPAAAIESGTFAGPVMGKAARGEAIEPH